MQDCRYLCKSETLTELGDHCEYSSCIIDVAGDRRRNRIPPNRSVASCDNCLFTPLANDRGCIFSLRIEGPFL